MQAIITKYFGATASRGSRIQAKCQAKTVYVAWDDALDQDENYAHAARFLALELGWLKNGYTLVGGGMPDGTGNAYVLVKL